MTYLINSFFLYANCGLISVTNRHDLVTAALIQKCMDLWKCDKLSCFAVAPIEVENDDEPKSDTSKDALAQRKINTNYIFADVLTPLFVQSQLSASKQSWDVLSVLIIQLLKNKLMTINYLSRQCVKLLRYEWSHVSFTFYLYNQIILSVDLTGPYVQSPVQ